VSGATTNISTDAVWSPDGKYLVFTDLLGQNLYAYSFDGSKLTAVGAILNIAINGGGLSFSPNGKYVACDGYVTAGSVAWVKVFSFTPSLAPATPFTEVSSVTPGFAAGGLQVAWSPDGKYLAVPYLNNVAVYSVSSSGQLSASPITFPFAGAASTKWSPCGRYIATGDNSGNVKVLIFDGSTLTQAAQASSLSTSFLIGLDWSPDGKYVTTIGYQAGDFITVLSFTGSALTPVGSQIGITGASSTINWSPDGKYIVSGESFGAGARIRICNAMYGPANCLINNCRVCDTQATNLNMGRGMVAGGSNVFLSSISSNNGVNYSYGIPNVYDGRFEILRAVIQPYDNVSMPELL
jgi:WD40 repeat protein